MTNVLPGELTFGEIAPKIVGIRFHETKESIVRMDAEIRWVGNPKLILNTKFSSSSSSQLGCAIEVSSASVSALVGIELLNFVTKIPFFKTVKISCLQKPRVDFSMKIGSLPIDLMSLGSQEFGFAAMVQSMMDSVMKKMVLYPNKMEICLIRDSKNGGKQDSQEEIEQLVEPKGVLVILVQVCLIHAMYINSFIFISL